MFLVIQGLRHSLYMAVSHVTFSAITINASKRCAVATGDDRQSIAPTQRFLPSSRRWPCYGTNDFSSAVIWWSGNQDFWVVKEADRMSTLIFPLERKYGSLISFDPHSNAASTSCDCSAWPGQLPEDNFWTSFDQDCTKTLLRSLEKGCAIISSHKSLVSPMFLQSSRLHRTLQVLQRPLHLTHCPAKSTLVPIHYCH